MKSYTIEAITKKGEKRLQTIIPSTRQVKRSRLYDKPLTYLFEFKSANMRRHVKKKDVLYFIERVMSPAVFDIDYKLEVEE